MLATLLIKEDTKNLFWSNLLIFRNFFILSPINAAGSIPTSERTEYLPPIKSLCSTISALNLFAISIKPLSFISVITNKLFFIKDFDKTMLRFVIVSTVLPDLETTTKQDFFKFLIFLNSKCRFGSKLSKKNTFFLIFFLKKE